jgi:hypothetical protein
MASSQGKTGAEECQVTFLESWNGSEGGYDSHCGARVEETAMERGNMESNLNADIASVYIVRSLSLAG